MVRLISVLDSGKQQLVDSSTLETSASGAKEIMITNFDIPQIDTEYEHILQNNLKQIIIRNRTSGMTKCSFVQNESGTKYVTIPKGSSLALTGLDFTGKTLYVQSDKISTLEIVELFS